MPAGLEVSGAIVLSGLAQQVLPANKYRTSLIVQNRSPALMTLRGNSGSPTADLGLEVPARTMLIVPTPLTSQNAIQLYSDLTGAEYTVIEGNEEVSPFGGLYALDGGGGAAGSTPFTIGNSTFSATDTLNNRLLGTYAFQRGDDAPGKVYPKPIFSQAPVASELLTHSAMYTHIVDDPNEQNRVFAHNFSYEASTGGTKSVGDLSGERVNLYGGMRGLVGAGSIWCGNFVTQLGAGYTGPGACVFELDLINSAQHRGDGFGQVPYTAQNASALSLNTLSTYRLAQGIFIDGKLTDGTPAWNRGFVVYAGAVNSSWGQAFVDYGGSYSSFASWGAHTLGVDLTNATCTLGGVGTGLGPGNGLTFFNGGVPAGRVYGAATAIVLSNKPAQLATYTVATLPTGAAAPGAGSIAFCSDARKPGEAAGAGKGMMVFTDTTGAWYTMAGAAPTN